MAACRRGLEQPHARPAPGRTPPYDRHDDAEAGAAAAPHPRAPPLHRDQGPHRRESPPRRRFHRRDGRDVRQELEGLLLEDFEGALWTRELLEKARDSHFQARSDDWIHGGSESDCPLLARIVIGVDPPASTGGDSCGILVCGKDEAGVAWVLADLTAQGLSPEAWARRVAAAADEWGHLYTGVPAKVVAEKNQCGDMIASILHAVDADLPLRLVPATKSKAARAEPIALRFETGRAKLAGHFPELEDQLCALTWSGYQGPGSPDRADAMVWAMTELFEKQPAEPRIRRL
jgi:phage terminase large subunit-like protein